MKIIPAKRIAQLAVQNQQVFHVNDLANIWLITNPNTLRITLKRYQQADILHRLYKGFYSLIDPAKLDPIFLGSKALHQHCYLSTETVLYQAGYIHQRPEYFTFVSEKSFKFQIAGSKYKSRQLKLQFLYNQAGIFIKSGVQVASEERAIADILYFNPEYHFDREVEWFKIKKMQKTVGYPLTPLRYDVSAKTK